MAKCPIFRPYNKIKRKREIGHFFFRDNFYSIVSNFLTIAVTITISYDDMLEINYWRAKELNQTQPHFTIITVFTKSYPMITVLYEHCHHEYSFEPLITKSSFWKMAYLRQVLDFSVVFMDCNQLHPSIEPSLDQFEQWMKNLLNVVAVSLHFNLCWVKRLRLLLLLLHLNQLITKMLFIWEGTLSSLANEEAELSL
jgi:hypothetical protein